MRDPSEQMRRLWKLAALKAFAALEPASTVLIGRNIGEAVFDELLNQSFLLHPQDPSVGAKYLHDCLAKRFGDDFKKPVLRKPYVKRFIRGDDGPAA